MNKRATVDKMTRRTTTAARRSLSTVSSKDIRGIAVEDEDGQQERSRKPYGGAQKEEAAGS